MRNIQRARVRLSSVDGWEIISARVTTIIRQEVFAMSR